jgi:hypothetical protein
MSYGYLLLPFYFFEGEHLLKLKTHKWICQFFPLKIEKKKKKKLTSYNFR